MRLTLLGTGTPAPSRSRQGSGYLVEIGATTIVFDHGPGAHHRLVESGRRVVDVTHACFSHLHYDHCLDFPRLVLQRWDQGAGRIPELQVYGPPPIARMTEALFGEGGVYAPDIRARVLHPSSLDVFMARGGTPPRRPPAPHVTEVRAGSVVNGPDWTVTVGQAAHVQPYLECVAFRLDSREGSICYSGDSGECEALVELARGCDVLIHMNHYLAGTPAADAFRDVGGNHLANAALAARAGVGMLVLTHVPPDLDTPAARDRIMRETEQRFAGRVVWGEDLLTIALDRTGVTSVSAPGSG